MAPKAATVSEGTSGGASNMILNGVQLTPSESKIAAAILELCAGKLEVDWSLLSEKTGHKTVKQVRDAWRIVKIKTGLNAEAGATDSSTPSASAKKPAAAKSAATQTDETGTPVKRGRGRPPKAKPTLLMTPGAGVEDSPGLSTPGTALGNMTLGDMTPETPSKGGSALKRSAEEADPNAILFEEDTPAKKKPAARKRKSAEQKAAEKTAEAEAAKAAEVDDSADVAIGEGDNTKVNVAVKSPVSQAEQAIGEILGADAAEAAALVGGIDPGEV